MLMRVVFVLKKCFCLLFMVGLLISFGAVSAYAKEPPEVSARAAVLISAQTGEILFEKNAHEKLPMASTTKIMTSLLTIEAGTPNQIVQVSSDMVAVEGTAIGLKAGNLVSMQTLVYGMLLESGNDAANAAAYAVAGSRQNFAARMNEKARQIGMQNTNFVTPSGLDAEGHYSTAYDMALLGAYCIQNPEFRHICSMKTARVSYGNPPKAHTFSNHNKMLVYYDGAIGIKTGFTKKSGRCLVSAAERGSTLLVAVTLNAPNDWSDHTKLFDYGFEKMQKVPLDKSLPEQYIAVTGGDQPRVAVAVTGDAPFCTAISNLSIHREIFIKPFEYAPIDKGDVLGTVRYVAGGHLIAELPITAAESVQAKTIPSTENRKKDSGIKRICKKIIRFLKKLFGKKET